MVGLGRVPNQPDDLILGLESAFPDRSGGFATTRWSTVLHLGSTDTNRAAAALERLCQKYWYPVYAYLRRRGLGHPEAEDLTQGFFGHLLEKETLKKANQLKGRFRSFLLTSLNHFLNDQWDKRRAIKRGAQYHIISLDEAGAEELYSRESVETITPEKLFERRWALAVLDEVLARLRQEYLGGNKAELFQCLEPALTGAVDSGFYALAARQLSITEAAARVALHRLRRRFGELLRSEIAHTVTTASEVEEEIRHLFSALAN